MKKSTTTNIVKNVHFSKSKGADKDSNECSFSPGSSELSMDEEKMTALMKKLKQKMAKKKEREEQGSTNRFMRTQQMVTKH